jgi:uncharacterized protein (UPF0332 family)/predicted nucleotidyltransferase
MTLLEKKYKALDYFLKYLLSTEAKKYIAKIILFGSVAKRKIWKESDVDLLVVSLNHREILDDKLAEASMETGLAIGESVEPITCDLDEVRHIDSYFIYNVLKRGKEVYHMEDKRLKLLEAKECLELSERYLVGSKKVLKINETRIAIESSYNALELAAKGLLALKIEELPKSHGGVIVMLGEAYIKNNELEKEWSKKLNLALKKRGEARYRLNVEVKKEDAKMIINLAGELQKILEAKIQEFEDKL